MAVSRVFHSSAPELKKSWAGNKVQSVSTETEIPLTFSEFWSLKPPQFPPLRRVEAAALWDYYYYFFSLVDVAGAGSSSSVLQEASAWLHTGPCRQPWGFLLCSHRTVRLQKWISINRSLSPGLFFIYYFKYAYAVLRNIFLLIWFDWSDASTPRMAKQSTCGGDV